MNRYLRSFIKFLPKGRLFRNMYKGESQMYKFAKGLIGEIERLFNKIDSFKRGLFLLEEEPTSLSYWQGVTGQETYDEVLFQLRKRGGTSRSTFIETMRANNERALSTDVFEFRPLRAGRSRAGDGLYNDPSWRYKFGLDLNANRNVVASNLRPFRAGVSRAGDRLYNSPAAQFREVVNFGEGRESESVRHYFVRGYVRANPTVNHRVTSSEISDDYFTTNGINKKDQYRDIKSLHSDIIFAYHDA